jgi:HEAT repeat protein
MPLAAPVVLAGLLLLQPPTTPPVPSQVGPPAVPPPAPMKPTFPKEIGGKDLAGWLKELKDNPDPAIREAAARIIPAFGPDARRPALKPLVAAVNREQDPSVWVAVIEIIGNLGPDSAEEEKEIAGALGVAMTRTLAGSVARLRIAQALGNYGPESAAAIPSLTAVVKDTSYQTRQTVAVTLGRVAMPADPKKGPNASALKALSGTLLTDSAAPVRLAAVQSLILLGPPAFDDPSKYPIVIKPYLDAVTAQHKVEKDKGVWIWLHVLLMRYDGGQFTDVNVKKIADFIVSTDTGVRLNALNALAMLGEKSKPHVPEIARALTFDDPGTHLTALGTLAALGDFAKAAIPELEKYKAASKDEQMKFIAQDAIDTISGKKKPTPPPMPPK